MLNVAQLTAAYGVSQALFDVSLSLKQGEVVALLGRNGAGKSTTIKAICRMLPYRSGQLTFAGHDLSRLTTHAAARLGIGLVPEGKRCFASLSVYENLTLAARPGPWDFAKIVELFPVLKHKRQQRAASLSGGEQQMLAIARAIMTNPKLLILDEATEGLAPLVRQDIWRVIQILKQEAQLSILIVDKPGRELGQIANRAVILQRGVSVWTGPMHEISPSLSQKYLGV